MDQELADLVFKWNVLEHVVYKRGGGHSLLVVGVYVDDLIICGPNINNIVVFKKHTMKRFKMSYLGLPSYLLGNPGEAGEGWDHALSVYVRKKIIEMAGMVGYNPCDTPMQDKARLSKQDDDAGVDAAKYRSTLGAIDTLSTLASTSLMRWAW